MATYVPGIRAAYRRLRFGTTLDVGGTQSARYRYSVWLRHLIMLRRHGLPCQPNVVAELGPGSSLGVGLSALLSGAEKSYGLDLVRSSNTVRNLEVLDELVELFRAKTVVPDELFSGRRLRPFLDSYDFPAGILTSERLESALAPERVAAIREAIVNLGNSNSENHGARIEYVTPWYDRTLIKSHSVDLVVSQFVLEHVDDLEDTYRCLREWISDEGCMSHYIDYHCHGLSRKWNGHWSYSDLAWRLARGRRAYFLNREPHSTHLRLIAENGFHVMGDVRFRNHDGFKQRQLARRFRNLSDEDCTTLSSLLQSRCVGQEVSEYESIY